VVKKYSNKDLLIVFVKNSELGFVKTRLAKTIGNEKALIVYRALVEKTKAVIDDLNVRKAIYYSDYIDEYDQFKEDGYSKRLQMGDDLGERMKNTFEAAFNLGFKKAVIIGSDCWELTSDTIEAAFKGLDESDFVLGPASDGGYYLMGMKEILPEVFSNKMWSSENVLVDTLIDIERSGKSKLLLPTLSDVDYQEDLPDELNSLIQ
jgi:uncharacterized protein